MVRTAQPGLGLHVQFSSPCSFIQDQKDEITKKEERNEEGLGTKKNLTILFPTDKALRRQSALPSNFESPPGKGDLRRIMRTKQLSFLVKARHRRLLASRVGALGFSTQTAPL